MNKSRTLFRIAEISKLRADAAERRLAAADAEAAVVAAESPSSAPCSKSTSQGYFLAPVARATTSARSENGSMTTDCVSASKTMTPSAQMSCAAVTGCDERASNAVTTSGAA